MKEILNELSSAVALVFEEFSSRLQLLNLILPILATLGGRYTVAFSTLLATSCLVIGDLFDDWENIPDYFDMI